jgi:hypothetical protein
MGPLTIDHTVAERSQQGQPEEDRNRGSFAPDFAIESQYREIEGQRCAMIVHR